MKKILLIIIASIISSCNSSMQDKIINNIQKSCQKDSCIVKMSAITPFDWEKMYVFREGADLQEINKQLGFNYPYFKDVAKRLIFIKSNKIIYHEDEFPYPDKKPVNKIFFIFRNDSIKSMSFTKESAVFYVSRQSSGKFFNYILTPTSAHL